MQLCNCSGTKGCCLALSVTLSLVYLGSLWGTYPFADTGMFATIGVLLGVPVLVMWILVLQCNKRL